MRNKTAWAGGLIACLFTAAIIGAKAVDSATTDTKDTAMESSMPIEDVRLDAIPADKLVRVPFTGNTKVYYPDGYEGPRGTAAPSVEENLLIYSNTLSTEVPEVFVYAPGWAKRIADDIWTEAIAMCPLTGLRVMVNGGVEEDEGDEFGVRMSLYDGCPWEGGNLIEGTLHTFTGLNAFVEEFPVLNLGPILADRGYCEDDPSTTCHYLAGTGCDTGFCIHNQVDIPPTVWLRMLFTTATAGVVVGTPAQRGFSADSHDHPDAHCRAWFGGYDSFPHTSYWVEMHSTTAEECPVQFLAYMASSVSSPAFFPPGGTSTRVGDDINLILDSCEVSAYELGIRGSSGPYEMEIDLRWPSVFDENVIDGTQNVYVGRGESSLEVARFAVPENLFVNINDQPIWITWQANRSNTGVPRVPRAQAGVGGFSYAMRDALGFPGWREYPLQPEVRPWIFYASIFCRGEPPLGACCQGEQPNAPDQPPLCFDDLPVVACLEGRWLLDKTCAENAFAPPCGQQACCLTNSNCDPRTRNDCLVDCEPNDDTPCTSDADCPGPRRCGTHQCQDDVDFTGVECNPDAGSAACPSPETCAPYDTDPAQANYRCYDGIEYQPQACDPANGDVECTGCNPGETCELFDPNLEIYQCHDGVGFTGQVCANQTCELEQYCTPKCARWNYASFCGDLDFFCPIFNCYDAVGDCFEAEPEVICTEDIDCPAGETCKIDEQICTSRLGCFNLRCCDDVCRTDDYCCTVGWDSTCVGYAVNSDRCDFPPGNDVCYSPNEDHGAAYIELTDESNRAVCTPQSERCLGVATANNSDATSEGSDPGFCCNNLGVDRTGVGTIWYQFVAAHSTARVQTCESAGFDDQNTLIQVFEPLNPTNEETSCASLLTIGCNDDYPSCGQTDTNSSICVTNLTPGNTYYIVMASSLAENFGPYTITVESPCPAGMIPEDNNRCVSALDFLGPPTQFNLGNSLFDCPAEPNLPGMTNDLWWKYNAPCTGKITVDTCQTYPEGEPRPATNLAVYETWLCPPDGINRRAWFNEDAGFDKSCTISDDPCLQDSECVVGCVGGPDEGDLCAVDAECVGWCDTTRQAVCITMDTDNDGTPDFPNYVASGDPCDSEDPDACSSGVCEDDLVSQCVLGDMTKHCTSGDNTGVECYQDSECPPDNDSCDPPCGWLDESQEVPWPCLEAEECEPGTCTSICAPGSHLEVPVFAGDQFMIRVGGEFGGEPVGWLSVTCEIDDCNNDTLPDLLQIEEGDLPDCNDNREPDMCDVDPTDPDHDGVVSADCNDNGIPDECEISVLSDVHCAELPQGYPCYEGQPYCLLDCDPDVDENGIPDICGDKCPGGVFSWPSDMIDARQPHELDDSTPQGIDSVVLQGPRGADVSGSSPCWELCETDNGGAADNDVDQIVEGPDGTYTIMLDRPITAGETTTITYTTDTPVVSTYTGTLTALPGDVDGNRVAEAADIDELIACLNGLACDEWQTDINRSMDTNAQDLLRLIDLLNGAMLYDPGWSGQTAPSDCVPPPP